MIKTKTKEILFAKIIGIDERIIPYVSQNTAPIIIIMYIPSEISRVCFVRITLIICGRKPMVVRIAPISPIIVTNISYFISINLLQCIIQYFNWMQCCPARAFQYLMSATCS